jgi:septum site-determining protein MinC
MGNNTVSEQPSIAIKGIREGLLAHLGEGDWKEIQNALLNQVGDGAAFFHGAKLALDVGSRELRAVDLGALRDALSDKGVVLWAVVSSSPMTETTAQVLGMATRLASPKPERVIRSLDTTIAGENAILVQRTLRSGFHLVAPGHVVVIGDINPGADIEAGGHIVVWGHLRGSVHAGKDGDGSATVSALEMNPLNIRIATVDASQIRRKGKPQPETAILRNGRVEFETWNSKAK